MAATPQSKVWTVEMVDLLVKVVTDNPQLGREDQYNLFQLFAPRQVTRPAFDKRLSSLRLTQQRSTRTSSYHLRTSKLAPGAYAVAPADPSDDGTAGTDDGTDDSVSDISSTEGSVETEAEDVPSKHSEIDELIKERGAILKRKLSTLDEMEQLVAARIARAKKRT